jgi:chromosome segregation ATPase
MNTLNTIETRLAKKTAGFESDKKKIENLEAQIRQYQNSVDRLTSGLTQKQEEIDLLTELQEEAKVLTRRDGQLAGELEKIREHFDQFEWSIDMPYEHKLESSVEYRNKLQERQVVVARLTEIEKIANKTYYRR